MQKDYFNEIEEIVEELEIMHINNIDKSKVEDIFSRFLKKAINITNNKNYDDLYFGEVVARYEDPRPDILEYRDISNLNDKEIEKINTELDGIEYSKTGSTRKTNVRKCKYVTYNKDWYIAINNDGDVEMQILPKDKRATQECKTKAKEILEQIKSDKIVVPIDFDDVGGDIR